MAQKFIVTKRGVMRIGHVSMHKDLLRNGDTCMGGGFWRFDPINARLELSGRSYDFGSPMWDYLLEHDITLKMPDKYHGLSVVYKGNDEAGAPLRISEVFKIEYV